MEYIDSIKKEMNDFLLSDKTKCIIFINGDDNMETILDYHDNIYSSISLYIEKRGKVVSRECHECETWNDKPKTRNEYEEECDIAGYNVEQNPLLHYSDSYFYCTDCGERNGFCDEWESILNDLEDERVKLGDYTRTGTIILQNVFEDKPRAKGYKYEHR